MPEMHLRQPVFTYGASWSFTKKKKKRIQKIKETGDSRHVHQNVYLTFNMTWLMEIWRICAYILIEKKLLEHFMKNDCYRGKRGFNWKSNKENKAINFILFMWKGYQNSVNSWLYKKRYCYIKWDIFQTHIP